MPPAQHVEAVAIAHRILDALGREKRAVSLTTLSRALGMTPTRVLRHLSTLVELRLVERDDSANYRLGLGLVELGQRASAQHDLSRTAYPVLLELNEATGQATFLVRPHQDHTVVWLSFESADVPQLTMTPGMRLSLTASICGRVILAFHDRLPVEAHFGAAPELDSPDPPRSPEQLAERLAQIRKRFYDGYGLEPGSTLYSLAAPVLDHSGEAVGAVAVIGFSVSSIHRRAAILEALLASAEKISRSLGCKLEWPRPAENEGPQ
ncbi:MAG TPA: IclR family transcriptional regulator [Rhizorhapis sp.]|nr:IclR family transcriptional regulator [Rhizorhapis sp.]